MFITLVDYNYEGNIPSVRSYPQVSVDQSYSYDEFGRIDEIMATGLSDITDPNDPNYGVPALITQFTYGYDADSNITSQQYGHRPASPSNTYGYDSLDRLTSTEYFSDSSDTEVFGYDDLGNRESVSLRDGTTENYTVNAVNNQYNSIDGTALAYDAAGNIIQDNKGYSYKWDHENHLVAIYKDNGATQVASYEYDALGRRIFKDVYLNGNPGLKYVYCYDGWQLLTEIIGAGTVDIKRDFAYGNGLDEVVLHHYSSGGEIYYLHVHLNSPAALVAGYDNASVWSTGDITERFEYDAYGKRHSFTADYVDKEESYYTNVGFTGQRFDLLDYDSSSQSYGMTLNYYKNRWYSPDMGRFLSNDPLGVVPESIYNDFNPFMQYKDSNCLYEYVSSSPLKYSDELGLYEKHPTEQYIADWYDAAMDKLLGKQDRCMIDKGPWFEYIWFKVLWKERSFFNNGKIYNAPEFKEVNYLVPERLTINFDIAGRSQWSMNDSSTLFSFSTIMWVRPSYKYMEQFRGPMRYFTDPSTGKKHSLGRPWNMDNNLNEIKHIPCKKLYRCFVQCCGSPKPINWIEYAYGKLEAGGLGAYHCKVENEDPKKICKNSCRKCP